MPLFVGKNTRIRRVSGWGFPVLFVPDVLVTVSLELTLPAFGQGPLEPVHDELVLPLFATTLKPHPETLLIPVFLSTERSLFRDILQKSSILIRIIFAFFQRNRRSSNKIWHM